MSSDSDLEFSKFREFLNLGMQVSKKHPIYMRLARLHPDYSKAIYCLNHIDEFTSDDFDPVATGKKLLFAFGVIDGLNLFGEITHLSMIIGDRTKVRDLKNAREQLNAIRKQQEVSDNAGNRTDT